MKSRWLVAGVILSVILQLAWPNGDAWYFITPNFLLVYLVVVSVHADAGTLLWMAFTGGLLLDLAGYEQFGLYMASYILLALLLKFVWRLGRGSSESVSLVLATLVFSLFFFLASHIGLFAASYIGQWKLLLAVALLEATVNSLLAALAITVIHLQRRGIIRG